MKAVYVVGTLDTKHDELAYVRDIVEATGMVAVLVDVGTTDHQSSADVKAGEVASHHPDGGGAVVSTDRGEAVGAMAVAFEAYVRANQSSIGGIIGIGGSGGTAIITPGMRALPVGRPKVMVSTVASGNVAPYVGPADIAMMYSVTDVAGLNRISRQVLGNAANAIAGMVHNPVPASAYGPAGDRPDDVRCDDAARDPTRRRAEDRVRPARLSRDGYGRSVDGEAGRFRNGDCGARHDHHRGRRLPRRRRFPCRPRPVRRDRPHPRSVRRLVRRARHGQLRIARVRTSSVRRSSAPCAQPAGDVDAHDGGREQAVRHVHRLEVERVRGTCSFLAAGRRCLAARCRRAGLLRSRGRRGAVLHDRGRGQPDRSTGSVVRVPHPINHPKFGAAALAAFHEIVGRAS